MVDWDGDQVLNTDLSARVLGWNVQAGGDGSSDLIAAARATISLNNLDGYFSPNNPSSALYGLIPYGKSISLTGTFLGTTYPIFRGSITDFSLGPVISLDCTADVESLREETVRLPLQEGMRVDQVIGAILDAASWPAGRRNLDVSRRVIPFFWAYDVKAWDAVLVAAKQELGGAVYLDRAGDVRFEASTYRLSKSSSRTLSDSVSINPSYRSSDLWNKTEFRVGRLRAETVLSNVFTLSGAAPVIPALGSFELFGAFSSGAKGVVTPVMGVGILGNSAADGSGTDKSAQLSLNSFTPYGAGFKAVIANSDSSPTYLAGAPSGVTIQGYAIKPSTDDRLIVTNATNPAVLHHTLNKSYDFTNDEVAVKGFSQYTLSVSNTLAPRVSVVLPGRTDADTIDVLARNFSDLVTIDNTTGLYQSRINQAFFIEGWRMFQNDKDAIGVEWNLRSRALGLGAVFRVSPVKINAIVYSAITAAGAVPVDRIGW